MTRRPRVLVVEDNKITRRMFRVALESQGWEAVEAGDGKGALEVFERGLPDIAVLDLTLPDVGGLELLERLHRLPGATDVPVIATSGFLSKLEQARSLAVGFVEHLFKPVDPYRLIDVVRAHLRTAPASVPGQGRRLLVVDDDPVQGRLLKLQLEHAGFVVDSATGGQEALDRAHATVPDLVVSDVLMPGLDGFRLCHLLRSRPSLASAWTGPTTLRSTTRSRAAPSTSASFARASAWAFADETTAACSAAPARSSALACHTSRCSSVAPSGSGSIWVRTGIWFAWATAAALESACPTVSYSSPFLSRM